MLFQGKDGELRLIESQNQLAGVSRYYLEVLFCEMDFTGMTSRPRSEETLVMDRGKWDTNAHYIQSNYEPRFQPISISFSARLADTVDTRALADWLAGVTLISNAVGGTTQIYSWDTMSATTEYLEIDSIDMPQFADSGKQTYRLEVLWSPSASASTLGYRWEQVYFPPGEQTITESADGLVLSANGQCYGDVSQMTAFSATGSGVTYLQFS